VAEEISKEEEIEIEKCYNRVREREREREGMEL
jgi:hypothetical protein